MVVPVAWWVGARSYGKEVGSVADDTGGVGCDCHYLGPVGRVLQQWRIGVAVAALVFMNGHRVVSRMTANAEGCIANMV